jgi:hypothetical protein
MMAYMLINDDDELLYSIAVWIEYMIGLYYLWYDENVTI